MTTLDVEMSRLRTENAELREALNATTDALESSWERRDLAPDHQLELVGKNRAILAGTAPEQTNCDSALIHNTSP